MKYQNLLLVLSLFFCTNLFSQTLLFGGNTGNGNFESGSADWVIVNGSQTNKWVVSNNATPGFSGSNAIYISSSPDAPYVHQYNENTSSQVYFYKDVAVPTGTKTLWLVFDYINNGETIQQSYGTQMKDVLEVGIASTSTPVTAGQWLQTSEYSWYHGKSEWQKKTVKYLNATAHAGKTIRVVFKWENNSTVANQPPAALDNIEMYASCQPGMFLTLRNAGPLSSQLYWYTVSGATGYELRYKKLGEADYSNAITVAPPASASAYTLEQTITGLVPATAYVAQVRPLGTTCSDYSDSLVFSTLTPPANDNCSGATQLTVEGNTAGGTAATFFGATPSAGLANSCPGGANEDVWFQFTARESKQIIQTMSDENSSFYSAKNITLFSGSCGSLQPLNLPCATEYNSVAHQKLVSRLVATGLTVGETYYVRVTSNVSNGYSTFKISVNNEPPLPSCPQLLIPAHNSVNLNLEVPQVFKWNKAENAYGYELRIELPMTYSYYTFLQYTSDTSFTFTPSFSGTYTWKVTPFNVIDGSASCTGFNFTTCSSIASGITIASSGTAKCSTDSIMIAAAPAGLNHQWFLDGQPIPGAIGDTIWAKEPGRYTLRVLNGACYSDPSNSITISNLATPSKPVLSAGGSTSFCPGGSVTLTPSYNFYSQWYNGSNAITGATNSSYTATQSGTYYVRMTNPASGCANYSDTVTVAVKPVPAAPVISAGSALTFCAGENAVLSSSAATGNQWYQYGVAIGSANGQAYTATQTGTYTVTTTENGCTSAQSAGVNVAVNALPAAPAITANKAFPICSSDSVQLQSSATTGNQWFKNDVMITGATGQQLWVKEAGNYTVKATTNGCTSSASVGTVVTLQPLPLQPVITAAGNKLAVENGATTYQWFLNNELITGATTNQYTVQQNGLYKVEITNSNGCKTASSAFNFVASAVNEIVWTDYTISLYPNPVQDQLTIKVAAANSAARRITAEVLDVNGKVVRTTSLKAGLNSLSLKDLPQGVYSVLIKSEKGQNAIQVVKTN